MREGDRVQRGRLLRVTLGGHERQRVVVELEVRVQQGGPDVRSVARVFDAAESLGQADTLNLLANLRLQSGEAEQLGRKVHAGAPAMLAAVAVAEVRGVAGAGMLPLPPLLVLVPVPVGRAAGCAQGARRGGLLVALKAPWGYGEAQERRRRRVRRGRRVRGRLRSEHDGRA